MKKNFQPKSIKFRIYPSAATTRSSAEIASASSCKIIIIFPSEKMTSYSSNQSFPNNLWYQVCFVTYPFVLSWVILLAIIGMVFAILPVACLIVGIIWLNVAFVNHCDGFFGYTLGLFLLYHVNCALFMPVLHHSYENRYTELKRRYTESVNFLTRFEAEFMLTGNLLHTFALMTSVLLIPGVIGILISYLLNELTGIPVIAWVMGICCLSQKPYGKAHAELKSLFDSCSFYASGKTWCNNDPK